MSEITTQDAEVQKPITGVTGLGLNYLNHPSPVWVTWVFRTEFVINKAALIWLASTDLVKGANLKEIILALAIIDGIVWGLGRFIGIKKADFES